MPTIIFEGPPLADIDKKRKLVAETSASAAAAYGLPVEAMVVIIKVNQPENVGVGGRLLVDRK
ncbi:MAG: tautomerase family protein [Candidatus Aminicenantes bacterium]|jgi:4-oxalocrotonate tautomerase|nr:tautomerase family protein [Candidatus Aminicenantes bacterium]MCJ7486358.1 tautomerase family protein [Candidatus Aminicenantes bacterium]